MTLRLSQTGPEWWVRRRVVQNLFVMRDQWVQKHRLDRWRLTLIGFWLCGVCMFSPHFSDLFQGLSCSALTENMHKYKPTSFDRQISVAKSLMCYLHFACDKGWVIISSAILIKLWLFFPPFFRFKPNKRAITTMTPDSKHSNLSLNKNNVFHSRSFNCNCNFISNAIKKQQMLTKELQC